MTKKEYRSDLSIAKNLGASGSGTKHWWHQRFTAIIMVVMIGWVFYFFNHISIKNLPELIEHLQKPINIIMMLIFSISMMYHAALGMQVVIEDYVHSRIMRLVFLLGTQIFTIITIIAFIVTLIYIIKL